MHFNKTPLSVIEQIELLQQRGLIINDKEDAVHKLKHIGYFRMSGYFKYFQNNDNTFKPDIIFQEVFETYVFDRKLRLLTIDAIEKIEVSLKSNMSNIMSLKGGCFWYLDESLFDLNQPRNNDIYHELLLKINKIKIKSSTVFIGAYNEKYTAEDNLPSWMIFEELTLGEISNLFKILEKKYRQQIANLYGTYNVDLLKWIQLLVNLRNISAHHARLWNRRYIWKPRVDDVIFKSRYILHENQIGFTEVIPNYYNACLIIHFLLNIISKNFSWLDDLEKLFLEYPKILKQPMGFNEKSFENLREI